MPDLLGVKVDFTLTQVERLVISQTCRMLVDEVVKATSVTDEIQLCVYRSMAAMYCTGRSVGQGALVVADE